MPLPTPIKLPFVGVNTSTAVTNHQKATVADNCDLCEDGSVLKRDGYRPLNGVAWNDNKIRAILEYVKDSGNKIIVFGTNKSGTSGGYAYLSGTPYTSGSFFVDMGLTGTTRPSIIQFKDLVHIYKNSNDRIWDGTNLYRIGIPAPTTACVISDGGTSGYTNAGDYIVTYTYYNSATGAESNPAPLSNTLTIADLHKISIASITAGDSSLADKIRIYRTVVNGDQLFLDDEIAINSTSATIADTAAEMDDVIVDSFLLEWDNDLPASSNIAHKIDNRIFLKIDKNRIGFSKLSAQYGAMPQSYPAENICDCEPNDGDEIVGINDSNGVPIVFKKRSFGRLLQLSQDVYTYKEIGRVGGLGHHACFKVGQALAFMGRDNVYTTDGVSYNEYAGDISDTIKDLDFQHTENYSAFVNLSKKQLRIAVSNDLMGTDGEMDMVLVGHYFSSPEWTFYKPREDYTSIQAGCFGQRFDTRGSTEYLFGNAQGNGFLYQMDYGDTDMVDWSTPEGIYFEYISNWIDFDLDYIKNFERINFKFNAGGGNYSLMVGALYDLDGDTVELIKDVDLNKGSDVWQDGTDFTKLWGEFVWANPQPVDRNAFLHRQAHHMKALFRQTDYGVPLQLFKYSVYGIPTRFI